MVQNELKHKLDLLKIHKQATDALREKITKFGDYAPFYMESDYTSRLEDAGIILTEAMGLLDFNTLTKDEGYSSELRKLASGKLTGHTLYLSINILKKILEERLEDTESEALEKFLQRPVIVLHFSNNKDSYLPMVNRERKSILASFQKLQDKGKVLLEHESQTSIEDVFKAFRRFRGRINIFHFGGHAGNNYLQLEDQKGSSQMAFSEGLANLFGPEENLKLVFLNGCATAPQVDLLRKKGVKAVIATNTSTGDKMATEFAEHFYQALSNSYSIRESFNHAASFISTKYQLAVPIQVYRSLGEIKTPEKGGFPWGLYIHNDISDSLDWKIS
jgi:hypothetical protein